MKYQRIRDLREDANLSQKELAEKLGIYTTS
jgi:transcriptional regulator with XRE-family HTH domain